jgi:hypothetical protein
MTSPRDTRRRYDFRRAGIGALAIVALLTIGALWQRAHPYSIETSTTIDATSRQVATALADWAPDGAVDSDSGLAASWQTHEGVVGWFDGEHAVTLDDLGDGRTLLTRTALFRGVSVLFRGGELRDVTVPSLHADNAALRDRVEAQNPR